MVFIHWLHLDGGKFSPVSFLVLWNLVPFGVLLEPRLLEARGMGVAKRRNLAGKAWLLLSRALGSALPPQSPLNVELGFTLWVMSFCSSFCVCEALRRVERLEQSGFSLPASHSSHPCTPLQTELIWNLSTLVLTSGHISGRVELGTSSFSLRNPFCNVLLISMLQALF